MNYKNQMLKQLASGSFGKKTYMDIMRNKTNTSNKSTKTKATTNQTSENDKNNKIHDQSENILVDQQEHNDSIIEQEHNDITSDSNMFIEQPVSYEPKSHELKISSDTVKRIRNLEVRVSELEDYIIVMNSETEKLKNSQKNMIDVINKLSSEIMLAKNKITR